MLASAVPYKFAEIWAAAAASGYITTAIPGTATGGAASQHLGFPPITADPIGSGGIPPNIADFNGVLQYLSSWDQWTQAGGPIKYDATFSAAIGGYPSGAMLANASTLGLFWISTVDNNTSDPDTGGANWDIFPKIQMPSLLSPSGWKKFPDDNAPGGYYIEQWGEIEFPVMAPTGAYGPYSFPIAFPSECLNFVVTLHSPEFVSGSVPNAVLILVPYAPTTTEFYIAVYYIATGSALPRFYWRAIGY